EKLEGNEFAARIESLGGAVNAFTSYDNTVYHIIIPQKTFEEGFDLLIESVLHPAFPPSEIEKERKVVLEEIKMGEDDPQKKLFTELFSISYHGHPYSRPIIGYDETVKSISRNDILDYYRKHYTPDNMTVVVVGDFDETKTRKTIEKTFGMLKGKISSSKITIDNEKKSDNIRVIERDIRENYLAFSYPIPQLSHKDIPAIEVLGAILGDGESSRLVESLKRKKGIVTSIADYIFSPKENGLFVIYSTFGSGEYDAIVREIDIELKKIKNGTISDWEMDKARNMIKASYIYAEETVQGKARQIGNFHTITGDPRFLDKFLKKIDKVTKTDVKRVLEKYLSDKYRKIVLLRPIKKVDNPYILELPNGLKCVVNKNKAAPTFSFRIGFAGGLKEEREGKNGTYNLLSRMLLRGTKKKNASAIAREIDFLAGTIGPYNGRNLFGLSGKFLSKDLKKVFLLLKEMLLESTMQNDELVKVKDETLSDIRQRDDDPVGYVFTRFNEELYKGC
ncbi:MAG: insulinase family protein, partial [Methanosarcina sp.]|nr:insulinase family protein [Methanosarcina sp.]